jgi:hypothetical protein
MADFILQKFKQESSANKIATLIWFIVCCQMMFFVDLKFNIWYGILYIFTYAFVMSCYQCLSEETMVLEFKDMEIKKDVYMTLTTSYMFFQTINLASLVFIFFKQLVVFKGTYIINLVFVIIYMFLFYAFQHKPEKKK